MKEFQLEGAENKLVVCRAQKKSERQAELKRKYEMQKVGGKLTMQIWDFSNLYSHETRTAFIIRARSY